MVAFYSSLDMRRSMDLSTSWALERNSKKGKSSMGEGIAYVAGIAGEFTEISGIKAVPGFDSKSHR